MALAPGTRLGPYDIVGPLGEGRMGEVYRARDSKLHRDVAIKVLPAAFAQDRDRLARFEREARTLAALNHPNIAHVYGLEDAHEIKALVMELVEGPTLADRLGQGQLALDEALPIARQIATALDAAHEQGIVHRDLKPANIKLRLDGTVKVLDFGLAKTLETRAGEGTLATMTSPAVTQAGIILGTAAYMSPEQARGKPVDKRTDIWAFGCVLFEMLTGRTTFDVGDTVSDAVAAVLKGEPQWSALPADTPAHIRTLLERCLQKDAKQRARDIGDVLFALEHRAPAATMMPPRPRPWLPWLVAGLAVLVAVAGWWRATTANGPERSPLMFSITPPGGLELAEVGNLASAPVISPDGSSVMFAISRPTRGLYVRRLDSLEARRVPGSENSTNAPFWSADASTVYYPIASTHLMRVRLPNGAPEVAIAPLSAPSRGGSVSDSGTLLISQSGSKMLTRSVAGEIKTVEAPGMPEGGFLYPEFLPGSDDLIFHFRGRFAEEGEVYLATLRDATIVNASLLMKNQTAAAYSVDGRVWFVKNDNLYSQRLNRAARTLEGEPELVATGVASQPGNTVYRADFSVARNGTAVWRPGKAALAQITVLDRTGRAIGTAGPPGSIHSVGLSPDQSRLLVTGGDFASILEAGQPGWLAPPSGVNWITWSADGSTLVGRQLQTGRSGTQLVTHAGDGSSRLEVIGEVEAAGRIHDLSPDRTSLLIDDDRRLYAARITGTASDRAPTVLLDVPGVRDARFSPDGRWISYEADGMFVQPFPGPGRRRQLGRGTDPVWRGDSKEIVFLAEDEVWSIPVSGSGANLNFGSPIKLFGGIRRAPGSNAAARPLDVSRDGSRFYIPQAVEQPHQNVIHIRIGSRQP